MCPPITINVEAIEVEVAQEETIILGAAFGLVLAIIVLMLHIVTLLMIL